MFLYSFNHTCLCVLSILLFMDPFSSLSQTWIPFKENQLWGIRDEKEDSPWNQPMI
jgi:hypothetical protein